MMPPLIRGGQKGACNEREKGGGRKGRVEGGEGHGGGSKGAKGMGVGGEGERGGREKEARRACASEVSEEGWHWGRRACMWYGAPWAVHSCGAWAMHAPSTLAEEARRTRDKDAVRMRMQGRTW